MRKIIKELKSQNILYYMFAFSGIIILIITVMGSYLYNFYYQTIYSDFKAANQEHVRTQMEHHESAMRSISDISIQVGLSENITNFKLADSPEKAEKLEKQLYQYVTVSQFFEMILYHNHEDSYVFNHSTSLNADYFLEHGCVLEVTDIETMRSELVAREKALRVFPEQGFSGNWSYKYLPYQEKMIIYMQAIAPGYEETLLFYVPSSYYDALLENSPENMRSDFIIYDGQVIVSRGSLSVENSALISIAEQGPEQRKVKLGKETYLMTLEKGESGLYYCSLQSISIFYDKILSGQWGILILLVVLAIPATLIVLVVSRRLVGKVRKLNRLLESKEDSYNITDIESGIQTLVDVKEQREKENRLIRRSRFVRSFVRSDFSSHDEAQKAAGEAGIVLGNSIYAVALLGKRSDSNDSRIHGEMLELIYNEPNLDGDGVHLVSSGQSLFVVFADTQERIEKIWSGIFAVGKEFYEEFVMAVSNYHTLSTEGSMAYLEADTAYDNRFLQDNNQIIRFSDIVTGQTVNVLPDVYLQKLKYAMKKRDRDAVQQAIEDICKRMAEANPSLFAFRIIYNNIIHILLTEWDEEKTGTEGLYNVFTLSQCLTIQDFNELLWEAGRTIIESTPRETAVGGPDVVNRAVAYIQENFASADLTMAALAEYLQVSSVTLSVVFKNSMGIRPSDYLANLRIERARELLTETNMLIREISLAVGYEDDHVFTRRFKKYTGMTPGQYREEYS